MEKLNNNCLKILLAMSFLGISMLIINNIKKDIMLNNSYLESESLINDRDSIINSLNIEITKKDSSIVSLYREQTKLKQQDSLNNINIRQLRSLNLIYKDSIKNLSFVEKNNFILNYINNLEK